MVGRDLKCCPVLFSPGALLYPACQKSGHLAQVSALLLCKGVAAPEVVPSISAGSDCLIQLALCCPLLKGVWFTRSVWLGG